METRDQIRLLKKSTFPHCRLTVQAALVACLSSPPHHPCLLYYYYFLVLSGQRSGRSADGQGDTIYDCTKGDGSWWPDAGRRLRANRALADEEEVVARQGVATGLSMPPMKAKRACLAIGLFCLACCSKKCTGKEKFGKTVFSFCRHKVP